jgi:hypothetical protein
MPRKEGVVIVLSERMWSTVIFGEQYRHELCGSDQNVGIKSG